VINLEKQYSVLFVSHNMDLTVIDGEICIAITLTSSAEVCNVCCLRQIWRILSMKLLRELSTYKPTDLGLSTLHAWIRFFFKVCSTSYTVWK